jgi:UDP-N-acetylglucosamine 3-dehydrogenase
MIRIGVIGVGKWGVNHLRSLSETPSCEVVGIADVDTKKKELAAQYKVGFFEDYHELLKNVDAVTVTTPTDTHYKVVSDCLYAGKHVLVEKPIAETSAQGKKLVELAQLKKLVLSVGYLYRFNTAVQRTKELLTEIGELEYITCRYIHSTKPPRKDSGVILNLGVHVFDMLNYVTDEVPLSVCVTKKNLLSEVFEDSASIVLKYKDFFAVVELSCMHPEKARDMWIIAEKETVFVDYFDQKIHRFPLQVSYQAVERRDPVNEALTPNEPLKAELSYFIDFIDKKPIDVEKNIGRENYFTTRITELCMKSAATGKELKVV